VSGPLLGYALARCHARHGDRPGAAAWRHLDGARTAAQFLHFARATGLRDWLRTVSEEEPQERVELKLRHAWRRYVDEVAGWLPPAVRPAAACLADLADLPALTYLHGGGSVQPWMADDPALAAVLDAPRAPWHPTAPVDAWRQRWLASWPGAPHDPLARRLGEILLDLVTPGRAAEAAPRLQWLFRSHALDPVGVFAHLGLTLDDLRRLAGGLARRRPGQARFAAAA
jgi:hypothetical protein